MSRKNFLSVWFGLLLITLCSGCGRQAEQSKTGSSNSSSIEADAGPGSSASPGNKHNAQNAVTVPVIDAIHLKSGAAGEALVSVVIQDGFHANANPPSSPGLIPTSISLEPNTVLKASGPIYPPPSATRTFKFSDTPLNVYEGSIKIRIPIKADPAAKPGTYDVKGFVKAQPCDEEVCYPPRNIDLKIPVVVD